jgi:DUF1009 family protein
MPVEQKIGLIAGAGDLPFAVISGAQAQGYTLFVAALKGFSDHTDFDVPGANFGIGEVGRLIKTFKKQKCTHIALAGNVSRPNFKTIKPDFYGLKILPKIIREAQKGDDALLGVLISVFEKEGFKIVAPQELCAKSVLIAQGNFTDTLANSEQKQDAQKAKLIAREIGKHDIGQAAIVCQGLVLAVEAQEGTDEMLKRVVALDPKLRGTAANKSGVLAKFLKPGQDKRVDLPTIGVTTIELLHKAHLSGIILGADEAFVLDPENVKKRADELGIFIYAVSD